MISEHYIDSIKIYANWDCVFLDEYHYGAWRENAKELFEIEDKRDERFREGDGIEYFDEEIIPITINAYLYLSDKPFKAITSCEFIEKQTYSWIYSDEKKANEDDLTKEDKKKLTEEEKEFRSLRKIIQEKLIKFATRIPIFMYLTDYRERSLRDVITQLKLGLFKKVTDLFVKDFELLVILNVFNSALMNDDVYKFKRYEESLRMWRKMI